LQNRKNNVKVQTIFVCIVENQVLLFVNVQKNVVHM